MLAKEFAEAVSRYSNDTALAGKLWDEIEKGYTAKKRYYHNQSHLENLLKELTSIKESIEDWDCIIFSIVYHDIVYNTHQKDNEEQSAALAEQRLAEIAFPADRINKCVQQILATKGHTVSNDQTSPFWERAGKYTKHTLRTFAGNIRTTRTCCINRAGKKYCSIFCRWTKFLRRINSFPGTKNRPEKIFQQSWRCSEKADNQAEF